jgi:hypothetical protein
MDGLVLLFRAKFLFIEILYISILALYNSIYDDVLRSKVTSRPRPDLCRFPDHLTKLTVCLSSNISTVASVMPISRMMNIGVTASILTLVHSALLSSTLMGNTLLRMRCKIPVSRSCCNLREKVQ